MTFRRKMVWAIALILVSTSLSSTYAATPKAGATCTNLGKKQVSAGKTFTCVKKGKKLVWNKGVKIFAQSPIPTPAPSVTPSPLVSPSPTPTNTSPVGQDIRTNLPPPIFRNISFSRSVLQVKFSVGIEALGGFVKIEELGIGKLQTLTKKDSDGLVEIVISLNNVTQNKTYQVQIFSFGEGSESPCCYGYTFEASIEPERDNAKRPSGGAEVNKYMKPPAIVSSPTIPLANSGDYSDLSKCRLPDGDPELTNMSVGFPIPNGRVDFTKKTVVQLLPVSFSDVLATTNPLTDYDNGISTMKAFWESQSYVGSKIEVRSPVKYKQLPNSVKSYGLASDLDGFQSDNYALFVKKVIESFDDEIDFSDVSTVVVVVPLNVTKQQIGTWVVDTQRVFVTKEKIIYNYMLTGNGESKNQSAAWVHEYGHALGLTDMRFVDPITPTNQKPEGLGIFDIMGSGSTAPEILLWSRFLINVMKPDQVICITNSSTSTHWIRPLAHPVGGLKGIIIPTGTYTALVVESRRGYGFDSQLNTKSQGVLVYRVDTRIPYRRSPVQIIQPARSLDKEWYTDSALRLNESVQADGWKFTVVETGDFGDVVKVERS